jgi:methylase of polypeptide subunit release factors
LEIGAEQGNAVKTLLEQSGFGDVSVLQDLNQRDRVVTGTLQM